MRNTKGPIAETYNELQGIDFLERARQAFLLPPASDASFVRTALQCAEVLLYGLTDLYRRATSGLASVPEDGPDRTLALLAWARDLHRLLHRTLRLLPPLTAPGRIAERRWSVHDSPALQGFAEAGRAFDSAMVALVLRGAEGSEDADRVMERILSEGPRANPEFRILHLARNAMHEAGLWEDALVCIALPETCARAASYAELTGTEWLREAVFGLSLSGDTDFLQFRILHQVPELLAHQAGEQLAAATMCLDAPEAAPAPLRHALGHLNAAARLVRTMAHAVPPLLDNLTTWDYHQIRENLGLTSGSHSVNIQSELFNACHVALWDALTRRIVADYAPIGEAEDALRRLVVMEDERSWILRQVLAQALDVREAVRTWRGLHLGLPRHNLGTSGSAYTRSLVGAPDAVTAVQRMRDAAERRDRAQPLLHALAPPEEPSEDGPLRRHLASPDSLDAHLLRATSAVTRHRFPQVQERTGPFSRRCPFDARPSATSDETTPL